jgi:ubiquinone/menaquinone biosynthesis C-methylase UbiE
VFEVDDHLEREPVWMSERNERRFRGDPERLRSAERSERMEPERVVALSLEGAQAATVLDVGTGSGLFAEVFFKAGKIVTGLDVSRESIASARRHVPEATFLEGLAESLPFHDDSFDLVFLAHVLHESEAPLTALHEARRVANRRVVVVEWPYRAEACGPPLEHRLRPETIDAMAEQAGLSGFQRLRLTHADLYRMVP